MKQIIVSMVVAFAIGIGTGYGLFHSDRDENLIALPETSARTDAIEMDLGAGDAARPTLQTALLKERDSCIQEKQQLQTMLQKIPEHLNLNHDQAATLKKELSWSQHNIASVAGLSFIW